MSGPLDGLRVVDFGHYIAGPLTALLLAEQGADVIHIDRPGGPVLSGAPDAFLNRTKRRLTLDLKVDADRDEARRLAASADVVIENFRPGVLNRLGLGLDGLRAENDRLITCSLPGFAADDPRASMRAFEGVVSAASGNWQPRSGEQPEGWDWSRPTYSALPLPSSFAAYLAATSIVMAAIARRRTGRGQHVDVPLYDAMFTLIGHAGAYVETRGLHTSGGIHGRGAGAFECKDGRWVQFDTSSPRHLSWFASAAGIVGTWEPELLDLTDSLQPEVNQRLHARLRELFLTRTAAEWEAVGNAAGSAIGFIRTPGEWIDTEHARALRAVVEVDDPEFGPMWSTGLPVALSAFPDLPVAPRSLPRDGRLEWLDGGGARPVEALTDPELAAPLEGIRVLDLGVALAGPTCGRLLAEFGAEVIKVAAPDAGVGGHLNRGKESLLLDLDSVKGQNVYWHLVDTADVVLENLSPSTMERLGLGYEFVAARRPEAVYTSISCYGRTGPWANWRGWERQGQAVTGIMERTALPSVLGPYNIVDIGTGIMGTFATGLALYDRQVTGKGQLAAASLVQAATYHQTMFTFSFPGFSPSEPRGYGALGEGPLQRYYQASDGWFFLAARPEELDAVAKAAGAGELAGLADDQVAQRLEAAFALGGVATWTAALVDSGVATHRAVTLGEVMVDPDARRRGLSITQEVEGVGTCVMPGISPRLSDTPARVAGLPHRPGQDAATILGSIGFGERLDALERAWVVKVHDLPPAWS